MYCDARCCWDAVPSDSDSVDPVGPDGMLSSSDLAGILFPAVPAGIPFPVCPVGPVGTLSPSDSDSVGPVGPEGTLSSSDHAGILFPDIPAGIPFPVGPVGPVGPFGSVGPVGMLSRLTLNLLAMWALLGRCPRLIMWKDCLGLFLLVSCRQLILRVGPLVWTEFPARRDPVITQLPAEVPVGNNRDVVDMDVTVDICQVVPDVINCRAVVAMVGLDTVWMGEETPMDCDGECAEWDIRNEFETVDGMPVYYGGDLYDTDDSDWEDSRDLAYAEYVDLYNFDAPEGMELKVFERLKAVDGPVMMVGEVTGLGLVKWFAIGGRYGVYGTGGGHSYCGA